MFLSEWREFPSAPCLAGKRTWWQLAFRCCWNRARTWHASELVSFLVGLRTYQHPCNVLAGHCRHCRPRSAIRWLFQLCCCTLTLILLTCRIWWTPYDASRRQMGFNPLTPNDHYSGRTAPLTSKRCILYIYSRNIGTEYFKHGIYSPFFLFKMQFVS